VEAVDALPSTIALAEAEGQLLSGEAERQASGYSDSQKAELAAAQERERLKTMRLHVENKLTQERADYYNRQLAEKEAKAEWYSKKQYKDNLMEIAEQMKARDRQIQHPGQSVWKPDQKPIFIPEKKIWGKEKIQYSPEKRIWVYSKDKKVSEVQPTFSESKEYLVPSSRMMPTINQNLQW